MKTKNIVSISILISLAVVLSIIESFIPLQVPGVKLGLANVVILLSLYKFGEKESSIIQIIRIFIVGLIYSGILSISFLLSLAGGTLSLIVMIILKKHTKLSLLSISIFGSISHSIGQIIMSYFFISNTSVFYYLPITITLSIICGILTALITYYTLRSFKIYPVLLSKKEIVFESVLLIAVLTTTILLNSTKKKANEGSIATITYNNADIMTINLTSPDKYNSLSDDYKGFEIIDNSYLYYFQIYNTDSKEYYELILEVKDEGIRIKEDTCNKQICTHQGYIYNKYEKIICLPNNFIVSINNLDKSSIDFIM